MTDRVVADRYAQAIVGLVSDVKELDVIDAEINLISDLLEQDETFRRFFLSPRVLPRVKKEFIRKVFLGKISTNILNMLLLIIDKHREKIVPGISDRFSTLANELRGVESGTVITAVPLRDDEFEMLQKKVQKFSQREITLHREVDPSLIGGVVLWLGDHVIDGSIRFRLESIKRRLLEVKTHLPE
ncbi:MAG: ATP synthase F1 subunit delta [bacterium]